MKALDWLLDADPAIRWQAMRDLTAAPPDRVAAERARVATEGWGARLLALELTSPSTTAAQLETFSSPLRLDELGTALKAFTALQVSVNQ